VYDPTVISDMLFGAVRVLLICVSVQIVTCFQRVCYLTIDHRPFGLQKQLNGFEGDFCTHVNVLPVSVDSEGSVFPTQPDHLKKYAKVQELRLLNPDLKILFTLVTSPGTIFSDATRDVSHRQKFAQNIMNFMNEHDFDGVDIDWEFPVFSSFRRHDKKNFVSLLQEIRTLIDAEGQGKLLSVAVAADITIISLGYDGVRINSTVDYINLMAYDYTDWHIYYPFTGNSGIIIICLCSN
jgi:chitinase